MTICCFAVSVNAANKPFTLVIDAGHGGHDTGALGAVSKEKNLTLKFALAFGRMVEYNCPDVKVIYTRKTDRFVELYRRAEIANQNKADLFISVHINALPKGRIARGFQTYTLGTSKRTGKNTGVTQNLEVAKRENSVILLEKDYQQTYQGYDPNSPESNIMFEFIQDKNMENSVELAKFMQRYVCRATGRQDMGAQQDNLAVLRLSSMPGCLVELGFITTRDEEQYMISKAAEEEYAKGLFNAFMAYKQKFDKNSTIPYRPEPAKKEVEIPQVVPQETVKVQPSKKKEEKPVELKPVEPKEEQPVIQEEPQDSVVSEPEAVVVPLISKPVEAEPVEAKPVEAKPVEAKPVEAKPSAPVFKVQILASSSKIKVGDARLQGRKDADFYQEGGLYKYTVGASENYDEIYRLRKEVAQKFPEAFIVAFKDGKRINVNEARKMK
ncbi:MAG: N-acetylmuramoyl-L-alanine amidase [Prevotella sp.]|nr:N-acetylmuramoyl-L-alanine amidase [Prevotella sp.]